MNRATWIGFCAIVMWLFLATFTAMSGKVPSFQLTTMAFLIAALPGMIIIVTGNGGFSLSGQYTFGYLMALGGAFAWAGCSLLSRRVSVVPTSIVAAFCLVTALLSFVCHFLFGEPTIWPQDTRQWLAVAGLGLFPAGLAFYCWDYGVKPGNISAAGSCKLCCAGSFNTDSCCKRHGQRRWTFCNCLSVYHSRGDACHKKHSAAQAGRQ